MWRARIVLATADGHGTSEIMRRTRTSKPCVWRWQERYFAEGVDGLLRDKTRPPGTPPLSDAVKQQVLARTASTTPPDATPWSVRTMAAEMGISHTSVQRIVDENFQAYGVRKVWRQLQREGHEVARCTVARLMKKMALQGVIRGGRVRTTVSDSATPCPLDHVNRKFRSSRPNELWVSDFTYVATWTGFVYVAFVIDAYARCIVGWRVSRSAHAGFVLDALEQALHDRKPVSGDGLVHHSDRGVQYVSIKYTERLAEAGLVPSVGSVGDSYDNALAETINGLHKAEVIHRRGPWRTLEAVEYATLEWVDWFNNRRLHSELGDIPPTEFEHDYYARTRTQHQVPTPTRT